MEINKDYQITSSLQEMAEKLIKHSPTKGVIGYVQRSDLDAKIIKVHTDYHDSFKNDNNSISLPFIEFKNGSKLYFLKIEFQAFIYTDNQEHEQISSKPIIDNIAGHEFHFMDAFLAQYVELFTCLRLPLAEKIQP